MPGPSYIGIYHNPVINFEMKKRPHSKASKTKKMKKGQVIASHFLDEDVGLHGVRNQDDPLVAGANTSRYKENSLFGEALPKGMHDEGSGKKKNVVGDQASLNDSALPSNRVDPNTSIYSNDPNSNSKQVANELNTISGTHGGPSHLLN